MKSEIRNPKSESEESRTLEVAIENAGNGAASAGPRPALSQLAPGPGNSEGGQPKAPISDFGFRISDLIRISDFGFRIFTPDFNPRWSFAFAITAAFALVGGFQLFHHVMWFDEWQAWLIAKDAASIPGLFRNLHYETHPAVWYLCLYAITRVTGNPHAMQIFHLAVAAAGVFIVAARSPLSKLQAGLYAFGFFILYEYCVISRSYVLGLFLMLLAVMSLRRGPGRLGFYLLLALLAQVDAFSLAMALALAAADVTRIVREIPNSRCKTPTPVLRYSEEPDRLSKNPALRSTSEPASFVHPPILNSPPVKSPLTRRRIGIWSIGMLIFAASCVAAYLQIQAPPDCTYHNLHGLRDPIAAAGGLFSVWLPVPQFGPHFWNTNILDDAFPNYQIWQAVWSAILLATALLLFSNSIEAMVLLAVGSLGITIELYLSRQVTFRHAGHLFMLLIAAYWIAEEARKSPDKYAVARRRFLTLILILQLIPSAWAFYVERSLPFSESREVAEYINSNFPPDIPVVAADDMSGTALAGYLGRPIYFESRRAFGTYLIWDSQRTAILDPFPVLIDFQSRCKRDVIFLLPPYWVQDNHFKPPPQLHLKVLGEYDHLIYPRDEYELLLAKYVPAAK